MAKSASYCLFLLLLLLLLLLTLTLSSSSGGALVGIPYDAAAVFGNVSPSVVYRLRISAADDQVMVSVANGVVPVDLLVDDRRVAEGLMLSRSAAIFWLKSPPHHVVANTKSITLDGISMELCKVLPCLKSLHSAVRSLHLDSRVKVSVQFPLSFLEKLSRDQESQVHKVLDYLRTTKSFVAVEARAELHRAGISMDHQVSEFSDKVPLRDDVEEEKQILPMASSRRELANESKSSIRDSIGPPTTIVTIPATPTITPTNPAATPVPVPIPSTTVPVANPITNPVATPTTPVVTNPVTTPAVTNPVIGTPPPVVTSPVVAPPVTNTPATPGQSWCIARAGASEYALQSALDYACGIGGADCSQIQLGAGCYSPNTLQNHASFAFNSYYQRNPVASSCDFGGTAAIVATNPSTGSCLYATYSSSSQPVQTPSTAANNPATTTTVGTPAAAASSYGSPPSVLNSSTNPAWGTTTQGFGSQTPPLTTSISPSNSAALQPFTGSIVLATLFVIKVMVLCL